MKETLAPYQKILKDYIVDYLKSQEALYTQWDIKGTNTKEYVTNLLQAGKLLRGSLILMSCEKENITPDHLDVATAIELFHTGLLVHDDIMDLDLKRRGLSSAHAHYTDWAQKRNLPKPNHLGISLAICLADTLFFMGYALLARTKIQNQDAIIQSMSDEMISVGFAQKWDVFWSELDYNDHELSVDKILQMYKYKTARYTFSLPFILGSLLNKDNNIVQERLARIGEHLGIIFQITDDLLEIKYNDSETGKSSMSDIANNKKTLPYYFLMQKVTDNERSTLMSLFGKTITQSEREYILNLIGEYEILKDVEDIIDKHKKHITNILPEIPNTHPLVNIIPNITTYLINRKA